jgi:hypothetical protein
VAADQAAAKKARQIRRRMATPQAAARLDISPATFRARARRLGFEPIVEEVSSGWGPRRRDYVVHYWTPGAVAKVAALFTEPSGRTK